MGEHRLLVRRDVGINQPKLTLRHRRVAVGDIGLADPQRFDFGSSKNDPALNIGFDRKIVPRPPVFGDDFVVRVLIGFLCHNDDQIGDGRRDDKP